MKNLLFLCVFFMANVSFALDKQMLLEKQFPKKEINASLKEKVPFLNQNFDRINETTLTPNNIYSVIFKPNSDQFDLFSSITGKSIFYTRFVVSWYIFSNVSEIPESMKDIMKILNTEKPMDFSLLTLLNYKWISQSNLPYAGDNTFIYVYISLVNSDGVLLPLASQSFYRDSISGLHKKAQEVFLNLDVLKYWQKLGYL